MSLSTFITQENVRFDGTLTNAVVISSTATSKTLIETDQLSTADRATLEAFMVSTSTMPRPAEASIFLQSADGTHATGFKPSMTSAGTATLTYKTPVTESTATNIPVGNAVAGYREVVFSSALTTANTTGFTGTTMYSATVVIDGVSKPLSFAGSVVSTFGDLITQINSVLGSAGAASITGSIIHIQSATAGVASSVSITPGTLLGTAAGFLRVSKAVAGKGRHHQYTALVYVDGVQFRINTIGANVQTIGTLISVITPMIGTATIAIVGGAIVITSPTLGVSSSINIQDTGMLFGSVRGNTGIAIANGKSPTGYVATITMDGIKRTMKIEGQWAQTYTQLIAEINVALGVTSTFVGGVIKFTSPKSIVITDTSLFRSVSGFTGISIAKPYATRLAAFVAQEGNGSLADRFNVKTVGLTPRIGPVPGKAKLPKTAQFMYFGGTPAAWRYLKDDSVTNPTPAPAPAPAPATGP